MGTLVGLAKTTWLAARGADHTYVQCGSGAIAWGCWGSKAGGRIINSGPGSTKQADAIAGLDERAGITSYLVNGVCHQAANRVLFPAGRLVLLARGYGLSRSIFGPYGRSTTLSPAPFQQHPTVTGDLAPCSTVTGEEIDAEPTSLPEIRYIEKASALYRKFAAAHDDERVDSGPAFRRSVFELDMDRYLGTSLLRSKRRRLLEAKDRLENAHEALIDVLRHENSGSDYVTSFNEMTDEFQDSVAGILGNDEYERFINVERVQRIDVGDPQALEASFGTSVVHRVYPELRSSPR